MEDQRILKARRELSQYEPALVDCHMESTGLTACYWGTRARGHFSPLNDFSWRARSTRSCCFPKNKQVSIQWQTEDCSHGLHGTWYVSEVSTPVSIPSEGRDKQGDRNKPCVSFGCPSDWCRTLSVSAFPPHQHLSRNVWMRLNCSSDFQQLKWDRDSGPGKMRFLRR